jgi:hypothetical protein
MCIYQGAESPPYGVRARVDDAHGNETVEV